MTISVRFDEEFVHHLKMLSHAESIKQNKNITFNELIRAAVEEKFPMDKGENYAKVDRRNDKGSRIKI